MTAASDDKKRAQALSPSDIDRAEVMRNEWRATIKEGVKPTQLLEPSFWAHIASRLTVADKIEAVSEDMAWLCDYVVVDKGDNWARVVMKGEPLKMRISEAEVDLPPGYTAEWKGPLLRWCVTRQSDSKRIAEKLADKSTAHMWVRNHLHTIKAA